MKPKIPLCLALVLALAAPAFGMSVIIQLFPDIIRDTPVVVRAEASGSGQRFSSLRFATRMEWSPTRTVKEPKDLISVR